MELSIVWTAPEGKTEEMNKARKRMAAQRSDRERLVEIKQAQEAKAQEAKAQDEKAQKEKAQEEKALEPVQADAKAA